jgi:hypothetical protein
MRQEVQKIAAIDTRVILTSIDFTGRRRSIKIKTNP